MADRFEYFTISVNGGATAYHHTTGSHDVDVGPTRYTAIAATRGPLVVPGVGVGDVELEITLPVNHPFVRRFVMQGVPPTSIDLVWYRRTDGTDEQIWNGKITSMACDSDEGVAKFRSPSRLTETILRVLNPSVGSTCPHLLYGTACGVSRTGSHGGLAHKVSTTAMLVAGRDVRVDLGTTDRNDDWALHGELVHVSSGERRTIREQTDLSPGVSSVVSLSMAERIPELRVGDAVEIYRGCDHTISGPHGCGPAFGNRQAFGGFNRLPSRNVHDPRNLGIKTVGEM